MLNEIKEIIEKNLPSSVGKILQERLAKAEADSTEVQSLRNKLNVELQHSSKLKEELDAHNNLEHKRIALNTRELALNEKERNLKIDELEYKLSTQNSNVEFLKSVALGLVKNTEFKRNVMSSGGTNLSTGGYTSENRNVDISDTAE